MRRIFGGIIILSFLVMGSLYAEDFSNIKNALKQVMPTKIPESITASPIKGLYEIVIGGEVLYGTKDGKYLVQGSIFNIEKGANETESRRAGLRANVLNDINENELIIFKPKNPKHTITVFTDIDCGYCRKLHSEMDQYNKRGISIRYAAFPRAGIGSKSYQKAITVWCSQDRKKAMTQAKGGANLPAKKCDNPVAKHYKMGSQLGVTGTPALFLKDGTMLPGYIAPARLASMLEVKQAKK